MTRPSDNIIAVVGVVQLARELQAANTKTLGSTPEYMCMYTRMTSLECVTWQVYHRVMALAVDRDFK